MPTNTGYGLSFQPGVEPNGPGGAGQTPLQSAIKLLSLRLPTVGGARGIAPPGLLAGGGSVGAMGSPPLGAGGSQADILAWLQKLLSGALMQPQGGGIPAPKVTPGAGDPGREGRGMPEPPPSSQPRGTGGGVIGGVLRGRTPGEAFPGGFEPFPQDGITDDYGTPGIPMPGGIAIGEPNQRGGGEDMTQILRAVTRRMGR